MIIRHNGLIHSAIIPLQKLGELNVDVIMEQVENVLQSKENLAVDESFYVTVGTIQQPKGGHWSPITKVRVANNSVQRKRSKIEIENDDLH